MLDKYTLMFKDIPIGDFIYNEDEDKFSFKLYDTVNNINYLPPLLYDYTDLRLDYQPNDKNIRDFIGDRVMPEERHGLNSILEGLGLDFYDPWEICKKCHGCSHEDYWWLKKENDKFDWREYHQIS
ncbi:hypothetical protein QIW52_15055 [Clostridioides difficile]|nr:hypothetical protein [Clostridioides difficile]